MGIQRFNQLEGVRGVAAIVVVLYHFLLAFYALAFLGPTGASVQHMRLEDNLYGNPIMALLSGSFAVAVFFVLSGFVLSIGFFQSQKLEVVKKLAAKRYLRLMLPALASVILCFIIMVAGISDLHQVAAISQSGWLQSTWNFVSNLFEAVQGGIAGIFVKEGNGYNNVLWTMMTEFMGSFLVFAFLALFGKVKARGVVYAFLLFLTFNSWFLPFVIGMIIADLYVHHQSLSRVRLNIPMTVALVGAALFFGGYPSGTTAGTVYDVLTLYSVAVDWKMLSLTVGATLLVVAVMMSAQLSRFFSLRPISILGRYTFSLYLVHLAVLYTFTMAMFLWFHTYFGLGFNISVVYAITATIPILWVATVLFEKYIDAPSIKVASYVGAIILGYQEAPKFKDVLSKGYGQLKARLAVYKNGRMTSLEEPEL